MGTVSVCLIAFLVSAILYTTEADDFNERRHKRDDGSYLKDSGGPVNQCSKNECGGKSEFGAAGEMSAKVARPCEMKASKSKHGKKQKISHKDIIHGASGGSGEKGGKNGPHKPDQKEIKEEFDKFMQKYGRTYSSPAEQAKAYSAFGDNLKKMYELKFKRMSVYDANFAMTPQSDKSLMDLLLKAGGYMPDIEIKPLLVDPKTLVKKITCKKVHWHKYGVIPDVRLQENCGSCYALSASDLIAAQYRIDRQEWDKPISLAAQYIADCTPETKAYKCKGGRSCDLLNYYANCEDCRFPDEECYPYQDQDGECKSLKPDCEGVPEIKIKWAQSFDICGPLEKELMALLLQHGPVIVSVGVTEAWQLYNASGIIKVGQCTMQQMHAVLVTGYDYSKCVPRYFVRNSWGSPWGGRGNLLIEAGTATCNICKTVIALCTADDCPTNKLEYLNYLLSKTNYPDCK